MLWNQSYLQPNFLLFIFPNLAMNPIILLFFVLPFSTQFLEVEPARPKLQGKSRLPNSQITVMGFVYCDTCSNNSFSRHSYFMSGSLTAVRFELFYLVMKIWGFFCLKKEKNVNYIDFSCIMMKFQVFFFPLKCTVLSSCRKTKQVLAVLWRAN